MQIIATEKLTSENFQKISKALQANYFDKIASALLDEPELLIDIYLTLKTSSFINRELLAKLLSKSNEENNLLQVTINLLEILQSKKMPWKLGLYDFDLEQIKDENAFGLLLEDFFSINIDAACRLANDNALLALTRKFSNEARLVFTEIKCNADELKLDAFTDLGIKGLADLLRHRKKAPALSQNEEVAKATVVGWELETVQMRNCEAKPLELSAQENADDADEDRAIQAVSGNCFSVGWNSFCNFFKSKPQATPPALPAPAASISFNTIKG